MLNSSHLALQRKQLALAGNYMILKQQSACCGELWSIFLARSKISMKLYWKNGCIVLLLSCTLFIVSLTRIMYGIFAFQCQQYRHWMLLHWVELQSWPRRFILLIGFIVLLLQVYIVALFSVVLLFYFFILLIVFSGVCFCVSETSKFCH